MHAPSRAGSPPMRSRRYSGMLELLLILCYDLKILVCPLRIVLHSGSQSFCHYRTSLPSKARQQSTRKEKAPPAAAAARAHRPCQKLREVCRGAVVACFPPALAGFLNKKHTRLSLSISRESSLSPSTSCAQIGIIPIFKI